MPRYIVTGVMTISMHVEVDADSPEEARKLAEEAPIVGLCHQCSRGDRDEWSTSGELDGEIAPADGETELRVEEL